MSSIHDVRTSGLSQIIQFTNHRTVVEVEVEWRRILEGMEQDRNLSWDRLSLDIRQSYVSNDRVDQGALGKLIGSVLELFDVDSNVVSRMALIFNVLPRILDFTDGGLELFIVLTKKDPIVDVDHENDIAMIEGAIVDQGSLIAQTGELVNKKFVLDSTGLLLAVDVLEKFQGVIRRVSLRNLDALGQLHVHVTFDWCLRVGQDKNTLAKSPSKNDADDNQQADREPGYNRCERLIVIRPKLLLSTVKVEASLVLLDLIGGDVPITTHRPY